MKRNYDDGIASPLPWRIERVTKQREAVIKGADNSVVAVCHADNAELIVKCVNESEAK